MATPLLLWRHSTMALALVLAFLSFASTAKCNSNGRWVDIWGSMPQLTEPANLPPAPYNQTGVVFQNATIRQTIRVTLAAPVFRLQISNAFGGSDLPITAVAVSLPAGNAAGVGAIDPAAGVHKVTFSGGLSSFTVPVGARVVSDPIKDLPLPALSVLTVDIYLATGQTTNSVTSHPGSRTTSWLAPGNTVGAANFSGPGVDKTDHWYLLSRVEGFIGSSSASSSSSSSSSSSALVIVGDSITDGRGSTTNGNNRWPDVLADRLVAAGAGVSVINQAAGGNRILRDGLGPNALSRLDRDVLAGSSVRYALVFEGVNDIGTTGLREAEQLETQNRIVSAYEQMVTRLHAHGIAAFGATITPMSGPGQAYGEPSREKARLAVNEWIRTSGRFDAVIDFDKLVRDPANNTRLAPQYDVGDYLHLSPAGYKAMGESIDLELFSRFRDGVWKML
ncbi:lipolytic enzyme [Gaeumannomyces tritici R3-111a-1]|uniref:Lipolytic enzyme n=1 Tax=Gaeumannomyces tritici (strain R3-111a-1) TaxID=644352 RepID=J3NXM8_GAET3|nr:lipolytic enzyme [Gaeumannomyces tritici R3-111a-1]EJT76110.1 lipolytic enzyme [Gaeumannomyces tritici R3-111a-1]